MDQHGAARPPRRLHRVDDTEEHGEDVLREAVQQEESDVRNMPRHALHHGARRPLRRRTRRDDLCVRVAVAAAGAAYLSGRYLRLHRDHRAVGGVQLHVPAGGGADTALTATARFIAGGRRAANGDDVVGAVSYTHLTLPTNREV